MATLHGLIVKRNKIVPSSFAGFGDGRIEIHDEIILVSASTEPLWSTKGSFSFRTGEAEHVFL